jgi:hypothetical protein
VAGGASGKARRCRGHRPVPPFSFSSSSSVILPGWAFKAMTRASFLGGDLRRLEPRNHLQLLKHPEHVFV